MSLKLEDIKRIFLKERRRYDRIKIPLEVFLSSKGKKLGHVSVKDVSGGGLKLELPKYLERKTKISLKIVINQDIKIDANAEVVWCKKSKKKELYEIGLRFLKIKKKDFNIYVEFICEQLLSQCIDNKGKIHLF